MDSTGIRANMSRQELISHEVYDRTHPTNTSPEMTVEVRGNNSASSSNSKLNSTGMNSSDASTAGDIRQVDSRPLTKRQIVTVAILCFVNLINYMDRFTIAGILTDIQCDFKIGDSEGGLLQTVFIATYMVCAPIFGYLGDRYSRKIIMASGIFIWSLTTLLGSFMSNFWLFLLLRGLVGVGEASYSTIAPTIISDLFVGDRRSKMLALFYFAIPVGSGLGYIVGSEMAKLMGTWHWGLRVTPIAGAIAVLLILLVIDDPPRGESEGSHLTPTSWLDDIKSLGKNRSFVMSTIAATAVAFVAGALAWWGPKYITLGLATQKDHQDVSPDESSVSLIFGVTTVIAGVLGVIGGSYLGQAFRRRFATADTVVCGVGLLVSAPLMYVGLMLASGPQAITFTILFFAQWFLNLNWALCGDILLYVVIPTRRSTAEAFQILLSHALGDAGSPYLIGQISEILKGVLKTTSSVGLASAGFSNFTLEVRESPDLVAESTTVPPVARNCSTSIDFSTVDVDFQALQYSLLITVFVEVIGGFFFLATAWYIVEDKAKVDLAVTGLDCQGNRIISDSQHRRPLTGESTPDEEQPITIITKSYENTPHI